MLVKLSAAVQPRGCYMLHGWKGDTQRLAAASMLPRKRQGWGVWGFGHPGESAAWVQSLSCITEPRESAQLVNAACGQCGQQHSQREETGSEHSFSHICSRQAAATSNQLPWFSWCLLTRGWWWNITRPSPKNMPPRTSVFHRQQPL